MNQPINKPGVKPVVPAKPAAPMKPAPAPVEIKKRPHVTKPPATLIIGPPGTGKTTSIVTYLEAGLEVFVIITDPGGEEALLDAVIDRKLPLHKLHWHYISAAKMSWKTAGSVAQRVNTMSYEALGGLKQGLEKNDHKQYLEVMACLSDFVCDRTGKHYGPVEEWDGSRALVIDSMTGINKMLKRLVVGAKPTLHQGEWGTAMEVEEQFLDLLIGNTHCFLCCIAHLEKTMDTLRGKPVLMASFLGTKLAPKIPALFSDVVLSRRDGAEFYWSTTAHDVDLKGRTLPLSNDIKPSFVKVVEGWRRREEAIKAALAAEEAEEEGEKNDDTE